MSDTSWKTPAYLKANLSLDSLSPFTLNWLTPWMNSLKSTSPLPSSSKRSITRWTRGFCCNSGKDMNSSTDSDPELSRSSFLNRFPSRLISSASKLVAMPISMCKLASLPILMTLPRHSPHFAATTTFQLAKFRTTRFEANSGFWRIGFDFGRFESLLRFFADWVSNNSLQLKFEKNELEALKKNVLSDLSIVYVCSLWGAARLATLMHFEWSLLEPLYLQNRCKKTRQKLFMNWAAIQRSGCCYFNCRLAVANGSKVDDMSKVE